MRITTQMLNESSRKAGLPVNRTSLLNYVNGSSNENSLLSALKEKKAKAVDPTKKANYEKLEKSADSLTQRASLFTVEGEKSIFEKAKESGSNQEIYDSVTDLVDSYNSTLKALSTASGTLNEFYKQNLLELVSENSEVLSGLGITAAKDGSLSIDKEKLAEADLDTLQKVLGTGSDITKKLAYLSGRIADNAASNIESLSSQYSSEGNYASAVSSKYNFWG